MRPESEYFLPEIKIKNNQRFLHHFIMKALVCLLALASLAIMVPMVKLPVLYVQQALHRLNQEHPLVTNVLKDIIVPLVIVLVRNGKFLLTTLFYIYLN